MTNPTKVVPVEPCPFCGEELVDVVVGPQGSYAEHPKADCYLSEWEFDQFDLEAWSRRAAPPASIIDDLEGLQSGWKEPQEGVYPEGAMLIQVDLASGRTDTAFVYLDDDGYTLRYADDYGDVWTAFEWEDVSRYMLLADIERQASDLNAIIEKHRRKG